MYGNYELVEGLSSSARSPLDIDWRIASKMDGEQFSAYCRITLITFKSYIDTKRYHGHSYALYRAFDKIEGAGRDIYKLESAPAGTDPGDVLARLEAAVGFVGDAIDYLADVLELDVPPFAPHEKRHRRD